MKYNYMYRLPNLQDYALSHVYENVEMVVYSLVCFFTPFFIGHPQIFVGIVVNAALITAALNLKGYRILPVIILPSLGALSRGILFGPLSKFLFISYHLSGLGTQYLCFHSSISN